jgi:hypothetical protein
MAFDDFVPTDWKSNRCQGMRHAAEHPAGRANRSPRRRRAAKPVSPRCLCLPCSSGTADASRWQTREGLSSRAGDASDASPGSAQATVRNGGLKTPAFYNLLNWHGRDLMRSHCLPHSLPAPSIAPRLQQTRRLPGIFAVQLSERGFASRFQLPQE